MRVDLVKTKFLFFIPTLCLLFLSGMPGNAGEPQLQRPSAMPENQLIVRSSAPRAVDSEDLAEALGIHQWNFQVQVPEGTSFVRVAMHLIQNGTDRDLGSITMSAEKWDTDAGKVIQGAKQFRVLVMVSPVDLSTGNPLLQSAKLRVFAKEFQSGSASAAIIDNPFKKQPNGVTIYKSPKHSPGAGEALRTRFDFFETDDHQRVLGISFETGAFARVK